MSQKRSNVFSMKMLKVVVWEVLIEVSTNSLHISFNKGSFQVVATIMDAPKARGICMSRMRHKSAAYERSEVKSSRRAW